MLRIAALFTVLGLLGNAQDAPTPAPAPVPSPTSVPPTAAPAAQPPAPQDSSTPTQPGPPASSKPKTASAAPTLLDNGLLDPSWFGEGVNFTKGEDIDFFWMKPGFDLTGHVIYMKPWEDPAMLKKGRDGKDNAKATEITDSFPGILRGAITGALNGKAKASRNEGDLILIGRFVDANAGSKVAKFMIGLGAGSETATWDLKLLDAKSGELMLAVHHRAISGTMMSSISDKLAKWADKLATFLATHAAK